MSWGQLQLFGRADTFQWGPQSQRLQRMEPESSFRIGFSSVYEHFLNNIDDQKKLIPLGGDDVPTTECRGEQNNNKSGDVIEVTQIQGASLDFKAFKRCYNYNSLWKTSHVLIIVIKTHKANFLERRQSALKNNFLSTPQNVQKEKSREETSSSLIIAKNLSTRNNTN